MRRPKSLRRMALVVMAKPWTIGKTMLYFQSVYKIELE
jgi:hypothetical protein